uniref:Secreted protein n=1 Tax=Thraustotheca clavata TaxID=74557 RepID=A0A0A7CLW0_9STRA|nr:secreted protein [Thraustotheca clavata]
MRVYQSLAIVAFCLLCNNVVAQQRGMTLRSMNRQQHVLHVNDNTNTKKYLRLVDGEEFDSQSSSSNQQSASGSNSDDDNGGQDSSNIDDITSSSFSRAESDSEIDNQWGWTGDAVGDADINEEDAGASNSQGSTTSEDIDSVGSSLDESPMSLTLLADVDVDFYSSESDDSVPTSNDSFEDDSSEDNLGSFTSDSDSDSQSSFDELSTDTDDSYNQDISSSDSTSEDQNSIDDSFPSFDESSDDQVDDGYGSSNDQEETFTSPESFSLNDSYLSSNFQSNTLLKGKSVFKSEAISA